MKLNIAQVVGLNTDQKAAQVTSSIRDGENAFLAVLDLECDDAFTKGRQVLSELEDFYFEFEGSPAEKLNATFAELENKIPAENNFNVCLASICGKVLYLIGKGEVEVYLQRNDKLSPLLSIGASSELISGFVNPDDRLLFSTKSLIDFLGSELEKSLNLPIEMFEEEVGSKIGVSDLENQGLAALAIEMADEKLEEIQPLPSQNLEREREAQEDLTQETVRDYSDKPALPKALMAAAVKVIGRGRAYFPKSGRGRLILAVVLIVIIALGAGYKYKSSRDEAKLAQFNQTLQQAKDDFNTAQGLASLNPGEAKNKLDLAKDKVNKALGLEPKNIEAQNFKKQIEEKSPSILQQSSVSDFPVFLDMDLVKKNFRAEHMSLSTGKLLLLDPGVKTLAVVDLGRRSNQILAGSEQLGDAVSASINGGLAFVYSKDKGILKVDITNQKITNAVKTDKEWGNIRDLYGFAGNVYVLDSGKNQIWKYLPASSGYSDKREYFSKTTTADLGSSIRIQIESSVYVLKSGGEILRFTKGGKDNFSFSGLPSGVKDPKSIFISSDTDNLYVLDSGNSRLLILNKTGGYKGQMLGSRFGTATDLAVDEQAKKVYLLDGSKIYSVDLK